MHRNQSVTNVHWPLVLSCENHATTQVIQNTQAALSELSLEKDPVLWAKHHICTKGLYYMEPNALHSNKGKTERVRTYRGEMNEYELKTGC